MQPSMQATVVAYNPFGWLSFEKDGTLQLRGESMIPHLAIKGTHNNMRDGKASSGVARSSRVEDPGAHDVILGRGSANAWRPGNQRLHLLVDRYQHDYLTAPHRKKKSKIIQTIYTDMLATGRFLNQGQGLQAGTFTDESEERAKTKIGNMFRDRRRKAKELHSEDEALMTALGSLLPDATEIDNIKYSDCKSGTETLTESSEQMATDTWPEPQRTSGTDVNHHVDYLDVRVDMRAMGSLYQHDPETNDSKLPESRANPLTSTSFGASLKAGTDELQGSSVPGSLEGVDLGGLFDGASMGHASPHRKGSSSSSGNSFFSDRALSSILDRDA
jgi:hypothetical protein